MTPDPGLETLLDDVWRRRRPEVLERLIVLGEAVRRTAVTNAADRHALAAAAAEGHRLAGAVGSLGFTAAATEAAALQRLLNDLAAPPDPTALRTAVQQTTRILHALAGAVDRPRRTPSA